MDTRLTGEPPPPRPVRLCGGLDGGAEVPQLCLKPNDFALCLGGPAALGEHLLDPSKEIVGATLFIICTVTLAIGSGALLLRTLALAFSYGLGLGHHRLQGINMSVEGGEHPIFGQVSIGRWLRCRTVVGRLPRFSRRCSGPYLFNVDQNLGLAVIGGSATPAIADRLLPGSFRRDAKALA